MPLLDLEGRDPYATPTISGAASGTSRRRTSAPAAPPYTVPGFQAPTAPRGSPTNTGITGGGLYGQPYTWPETVQQPTQSPFNYNAFKTAAEQASAGTSGSLDDFINTIYPQLESQFPGIERFGSKGDKIRLPNGQTIDAVISAGLGGQGYQWSPDAGGGMGNYWNDPALQQFFSLGEEGIGRLLGPQETHPVLQQALSALTALMNTRDSGYEQFQGIAGKRLAQLDQPAYTPEQRALIQTNFSEPLEAQRKARQTQALERNAARGLGLSSGLIEGDVRDIDRSFDEILGEGQRQLAVGEIGANEARQQEAVNIGQMLASLSGKNLPLQLSAASQMGNIGQSLQNEPTQRLLQALGISGQMAQMPFQALAANQSALGSLNATQVPQADNTAGLITALLALANGGTAAGNQAAGQDQAFWGSLLSSLPGLLGLIPGMSGTRTATSRPVV